MREHHIRFRGQRLTCDYAGHWFKTFYYDKKPYLRYCRRRHCDEYRLCVSGNWYRISRNHGRYLRLIRGLW
jgi:hypothetical protein